MCYILFISHSLHWRYIKIALQEYVIMPLLFQFVTINVIELLATWTQLFSKTKFEVNEWKSLNCNCRDLVHRVTDH